MQKYKALEANLVIPSHGDLVENPQGVIEDAVRKVKKDGVVQEEDNKYRLAGP